MGWRGVDRGWAAGVRAQPVPGVEGRVRGDSNEENLGSWGGARGGAG